ncbi:MAG TPA: leucine-rich repeat protein [Mobilitalea sp.]|nr:leucine-rich repeat protein [Mobilitalea sp.]
MTAQMKDQLMKKRTFMLFIIAFVVFGFIFWPGKATYAKEETVYSDGIYRYIIKDNNEKKVQLIGIESDKATKELYIPGKVFINNIEYTVDLVDIYYEYYSNEKYAKFYSSVSKINVADNFTGSLRNLTFAFENLEAIEFYGKDVPKEVDILLFYWNLKDFLFIVPKGTENAYSKVINIYIHYYFYSDLYEQDIEVKPTIISGNSKDIEFSYFAKDGFIYRVTKSAKKGKGKVELVGITHSLKLDYLKLPDKVSHNGYTYELTKLRHFALLGCGARVIVVPDSVTEMEGRVFDSTVELLFLSKNCKKIPSYMVADENSETNLRFVYVPEGVTTISDYAFNNIPLNTASIILPTTVTKAGKNSLYTFKLVTFLNKKPLDNVAAAVKKGTTVKVDKSAVSAFKKILGSKASVVEAKKIVKTKDIKVNKEELKLSTYNTATLIGTLSKGSNETIYWLSANPDILEVSSKGVITPKKAGTTYVVAYTRTSGRHKAVKVTVTEAIFDDGIFTYRITDPSKKTVTLCEISPDKSLKTLTIPETVTYKKVKYTVTSVIANPDDPAVPLIPEKYSNNKIKTIIFPKSITGKVGYLGVLKNIESITFKGTKAPEAICNWYEDGGLLAWQAVIYVPKKCVSAYTSVLWLRAYDTYQQTHYGCIMDFNVVETGNDQVKRFVADGILYHVTKYASKKNSGEVIVKGADVNLKKIVIKNTVKYKGYTYKVTAVSRKAIDYKGKEVYIDKSVKRN